jgi:L-amino acid N-acyltransferase YncA
VDESISLLIDANILIPLEPTSPGDAEEGTEAVVELAHMAAETGSLLLVHPAVDADIQDDSDDQRRALRAMLVKKYPRLPDPPAVPVVWETVLGRPQKGSNDWVDNQLLAAVHADAVDYLVTQDRGLHRKARRLGLENRVADTAEAVSVLRGLFDMVPEPPPAVRHVRLHLVNANDPIFDSLRSDYPDFDSWLKGAKRQRRHTWVIDGIHGQLAAICVVKREGSGEHGLRGKVLKVCTFKVSEEYSGYRFGELLLKAVLEHARASSYRTVYVTVFEKHGALIDLLDEFGFESQGTRTALGELVLVKSLLPSSEDCATLNPLSFNRRYGPYGVKIRGVATFVVPIKPQFHRVLFPDAEDQISLWPGAHAFGNSIRKAYLCNAPIRAITPGANLLFYRSADIRAVTVLGVVEDTTVTRSATEAARFVGKRTVYSLREIEKLCTSPVLAILFRQSRVLREPIPLKELIAQRVLTASPQSIRTVPKEATEWLEERLGA